MAKETAKKITETDITQAIGATEPDEKNCLPVKVGGKTYKLGPFFDRDQALLAKDHFGRCVGKSDRAKNMVIGSQFNITIAGTPITGTHRSDKEARKTLAQGLKLRRLLKD